MRFLFLLLFLTKPLPVSAKNIFKNKFANWSIEAPSCYKMEAPSDESTAAGSVSFSAKNCDPRDHLDISALSYPTDVKNISDRLNKSTYKTGAKKLLINKTKVVMYLHERIPSKRYHRKNYQKVSWEIRIFCNNEVVYLSATDEIKASEADFKRRTTSLEGPPEETMKILKTFRCLKKEKPVKAPKKKNQ